MWYYLVLLKHDKDVLQHVPGEREHMQLPFPSLLHLHASCVTLILLHQQIRDGHTIVPEILSSKEIFAPSHYYYYSSESSRAGMQYAVHELI